MRMGLDFDDDRNEGRCVPRRMRVGATVTVGVAVELAEVGAVRGREGRRTGTNLPDGARCMRTDEPLGWRTTTMGREIDTFRLLAEEGTLVLVALLLGVRVVVGAEVLVRRLIPR